MAIYSISLKGLRPQNEDAHNIEVCKKSNKVMLAIYDGHGGKEVSKLLANKLPKYLLNENVSYPLERKYVSRVYDHIQTQLKNMNYAYHSGSTALVLLKFKYNNANYLNIMNLGDCRAVVCRGNLGMALTKDHKPHWPEERHRIEKLGGKITFDGYDWRIKDLSVSRAFGDIDATPYVTHKPDLFRYKLSTNDKFVILACDGLWDVISTEEAVNFVLLNCYDNNFNKRINKNINIAKKLAEYALKKGSTDNVTTIVYFFD